MNEENNEIIENMTQEERDKWHAVSNFFKQINNLRLNNFMFLTPTLSAWPLRSHWALKSIL